MNEINLSTENPLIMNLNTLDFKISFGVYEEDRMIPLDKRLFNYTGKQVMIIPSNTSGNFKIIVREFALVRCKKGQVPQEQPIDKSTEDEWDPTYLCFDNKFLSTSGDYTENELKHFNQKGFFLDGFFGSKELVQLFIGVSRCINSTNMQPDEGKVIYWNIRMNK